MTDPAQTFKLYGPDGTIIAHGALSSVMEHLPDTHARNDALSTMLDTAVKQVEAEERADEARACAAKILSDGITQLASRMDAFEKQRAISMKRAHAEQQRRDRHRVAAMLDQLPDPDDPEPYSFDPTERVPTSTDQDPKGIIPEPADPTGTELENDDGELTIKHEVDPERHGEDAGPERAALSYANVPMSYIKKKDEDLPPGHDPMPFDPAAPGAVDVPPTGFEPGSRLYQQPHPGIPQPISISLNSET
jgi:hypothetical protein